MTAVCRSGPRRSFVALAGLCLTVALGGLPAAALAAFPEKPLRLVVPYPPGGAADVMARGLAQQLGDALGQKVIVDNRGGAGGAVAAKTAAASAADGYTLFFGTLATQVINPALNSKLGYDPVKDFAGVSLTHLNPRVLIAGPSVQARSVAELIAAAKAAPGKLTYGSAGNGSSSHLSGALFEMLADVQLLHVPYRGSAPLLTDLLAGRVDLTFDSFAVYEEFIKEGRARPLAVTSLKRMTVLPSLPTLDEAGLAGYDVSNWLGIFVPAGTSAEAVATLNAGVRKAMAEPALRQQLVSLGIEPATSSPEELDALVRDDTPKWADIVKRSGAKVD
jgi:tripartite-type tricarboxylate transporter receptor subunit TctC